MGKEYFPVCARFIYFLSKLLTELKLEKSQLLTCATSDQHQHVHFCVPSEENPGLGP